MAFLWELAGEGEALRVSTTMFAMVRVATKITEEDNRIIVNLNVVVRIIE